VDVLDGGDGTLPLFLLATISNPSALSVACEVSRCLMLAVWAYRAARLASMPSKYAWYVRHSFFCHALCALPQLQHDTLCLEQSFVWWEPAHSPHLACLPHAAWVWPHWLQLKHCLT